MINKDISLANNLHLTDSVKRNDIYKDKEYRKILKELGFEKADDDPLTEQELREIFIFMQGDLLIE